MKTCGLQILQGTVSLYPCLLGQGSLQDLEDVDLRLTAKEREVRKFITLERSSTDCETVLSKTFD